MTPAFMHPWAPADTGYAGAPLDAGRSVAILLHGRGSSPDAILSLARLFPAERFHCVAPAAAGGAWYPQRFLAPLSLNQPWLDRSLAVIEREVRVALLAGVPRERIALVGFSQGACLALEYVARNPARYLFVGGLSGALVGPLDTPRAKVDLQKTPVLLSCAEEDGHIPRAHVEFSARWLSEQGANVTAELLPGSQHTVFPSAVTWLKERTETA